MLLLQQRHEAGIYQVHHSTIQKINYRAEKSRELRWVSLLYQENKLSKRVMIQILKSLLSSRLFLV